MSKNFESRKHKLNQIFCYYYKLQSLEQIFHPLKCQFQNTQIFLHQQPLMGCIGFSKDKRIQRKQYFVQYLKLHKKQTLNQESIDLAYKKQNLIENNVFNIIKQTNNICKRYSSMLSTKYNDNCPFIYTSLKKDCRIHQYNFTYKKMKLKERKYKYNKDSHDHDIKIRPQDQISSMFKNYQSSYYSIALYPIVCKNEVLSLKQQQFYYEIFNSKKSVILFKNMFIKNQSQIILCFEQENWKIHFFILKLKDQQHLLHYIGYCGIRELIYQPKSILKYYWINGRIMIVYNFKDQNSERIKLYSFCLQEDPQSYKMIITKGENLFSNSCDNFFFSRDDGALEMAYEQNGALKIEVLRYAEMKQIYLHFLLNINQDFDDDLLSDAIEMM